MRGGFLFYTVVDTVRLQPYQVHKADSMTKEEFRALILQESGIIHSDPTGFSVCHSCGATGNEFEESIQHLPSCKMMQAIQMITQDMPDDFILGVENQLTVSTLLDFIQTLEPEDVTFIDQLTTKVMKESDIALRMQYRKQLIGWAPSANPALISAIVRKGLINETQRISFRNYMIFEKATSYELEMIQEHLRDVLQIRERTGKVFDDLFLKKYKVPLDGA